MLRFALPLCFLLTCFNLYASEPPVTIIEDKADLPILTPSLQDQKTRKIVLPNGLQAYLISDPGANKSAAALAVAVGQWSDPANSPGMAHFCEHLLFLGTVKYPQENDYDRFLRENDGDFNAYTASDHTNYQFSIDHTAYPEALDRFSWFFKAPLFNESGVDREVNAIDQEYAKNVEVDTWREYSILKELSNPNHPDHQFGMGNRKSLAQTTSEDLKTWYAHHYSSHLMTLVLYSKLSLDELQNLVEENFTAVPKTDATRLVTPESIYPQELLGKAIYITPIKDIRTLCISWELPQKFAFMLDTKPDDLLSMVLGHEGAKSLLAQLKTEGLAEGLYAGGYRQGYDHLTFRLQVTLTEKGMKQREQVLNRIYQTMAMLRTKGIPQYLFEETRDMALIRHEYQSRQDAMSTVTQHARNLIYEDLATYPRLTKIPQRLDTESVNEMISLLTPQMGVLIISGQPSFTGVAADHKEQWLGGQYAVRQQPATLLTQLAQLTPVPEIDLPDPNPYVPHHLALLGTIKQSDQLPHPSLLHDGDDGALYFQTDEKYMVPEIVWVFNIKTPELDPGNAKKTVLAELYTRAVSESLNSVSYMASLAGLQFDLAPNRDGIKIVIQGYSEKADTLFQAILKELKGIKPSKEEFKVYHASLQRKYRNFSRESSLTQGLQSLKRIIYQDYVSDPEKAKAIKDLKREDLLAFTQDLYDRYYVEGMVYGNMTQDGALAVWQQLHDALGGGFFPTTEHMKERVVSLPKQGGPFYVREKVLSPGNAVLLMVEFPSFTFETRAAQQILDRAIQEPFYTALRTKQQTGYIVHSWVQEIEKQLYAFFAVQSNSHEGRDLLARFELLFESFLQELGKDQGFTKERFDVIKESQLAALKQLPKNMAEMTDLLNLLAFDYKADFDWMRKRQEGMEELDYSAFNRYVQTSLGRQNKQRVALLMEGQLPAQSRFTYENVRSLRKLRQISHFVAKDDTAALTPQPH